MEYELHIPACVVKAKPEPVTLPPMRQIAVMRQLEEVGCRIPTDQRLLKWRGPMGGAKRVAVIGAALMQAIEAMRPQFHRAIIGTHVFETEGTSIYLTGRTKGGGETIVATWDYGEPVTVVMDRLNRMRRLIRDLPAHVVVQYQRILTPENELMPAAALLSDVISDGEENPYTSLFGCGGSAPVSLAVGTETTHLVVEHRLHDPVHFMALAKAYQQGLAKALDMRGINAA